jgi:beta-galactosidase
MWSVGNEIKEMSSGNPKGLEIMKDLRETCRAVDPTRPMTCGCNAIRTVNGAGYGPLMDVVGYNGGGGSCFDYEKDHAAYPKRVIFASEVPHTLQTRGVYRTKTWFRDLASNPDVERMDVPHLTREEIFTTFDSHYQSSYDNALVRISCMDSWRLTSSLPFMCGEFRWSGFDYVGECYGWPAKSWNFGIIDLCGLPKDSYFFYQSRWTDRPMVHLLPHWTWPGLEGVEIPIVAYTNCDAVELFLDGESAGVREMDDSMYLRWDLPYQPGILSAVGFVHGTRAAECFHETAGSQAAIALSCDEQKIRGGGVAHVAVSIVDQEGRFVPHAGPDVTFHVEGPGTLIGLENGDPIDTTNYTLPHRRAFNGRALGIIKAAKKEGPVVVTVSSDGLQSATLELPVFIGPHNVD